MTSFPNTTRSILLVFGILTSGSGCHVLNIPVNPAGGGCGVKSCGTRICGTGICQGTPTRSVEPHYYSAGVALDGSCPPDWLSPLPRREIVGLPVPKWWADWRAKKDLPEPPPYPRFHPLPSRPMFQPQSGLSNNFEGSDHWGNSPPAPPYGQLPDTQSGRAVWESPAGRP